MGTNHAPSPGQLTDIKALLIEPYLELEHLKLAIAQALCEEKINNFIEAHRALLCPARRVPEDVLAEIFVHCLPTDRHAIRSLQESPLLLTIICRDWRRIAFNSPRLWSSLHIFLPPHLNAQAIFKRAAGISQCTATTHPDFIDNLKFLNCTLASFGQRFALQYFRMRDADVYNGRYRAWGIEGVDDNKIGSVGHLGYLSLPIDWGILNDLTLQSDMLSVGVIPSEALKIMQKTSNLQSLRICFMLSQERSVHSALMGKITLPHLQNMWLNFSPGLNQVDFEVSEIIRPQISSIFGSLSTPSLKLLSLIVYNGSRIFEMKTVQDSTGIPFHNLETLELSLEMTPEELTESLLLAPELVSLHFKDMGTPPCFSDSHLSALSPSLGNSTPLCPKLTNIEIVFYIRSLPAMKTLGSSSILKFARSRAETLKRFDMFFEQEQHFAEADFKVALRKLKEDGLNIRLHYAKCYPGEPPQDSPSCGLSSEPVFTDKSDMEGEYGTQYIV
ncbi:hypothetical protein EV360DRAFT_84431 [Lentinula raphanica]|nr:hypothetical protein EV360DRAFT_84431 [Lentinula raphanica]